MAHFLVLRKLYTMTKRKRIWINDSCYHITHRCHGRGFLFKFEKYAK